MPTEVLETPVVVETPKPAFDFAKFQAERAAGKSAEIKPADAATPPTEVVKRLSGDERKFRRMLSKRDQELGALRAQVEALTPKAAPVVAAPPPPQTEDEIADAKTAAAVAKALEKDKAAAAQTAKIDATLAAYNDQIAKGPERYDDWAETLAAGSGGALSVDLGKECPSLLWAITASPVAADCFYAWLKDSKKLQALIDTYKSGPDGPTDAITAFHRFEGRVGKDAPAAKAEVKEPKVKAEDAVVPKAPKPKPSAEATVRGGTPAPDGAPKPMLSDGTLNPAWKAFRNSQERR